MDDDDEMMWDDAGEDYDQGDDGDDEAGDDDDEEYKWENTYFQAKDMVDDNPKNAIKEFEKIVDGESPAGDWTYKSLKRLVKLYFQAGNFDKVMSRYKLLLRSKGRSDNELFKGINKCLDIVSTHTDMEFVYSMFDECFTALAGKSENNLFKVKNKLAKMLVDRKETKRLDALLRDLKSSCYKDGKLDPKKGSNLIDIYSIEIQMALDNKDRKRTREIHDKALQVAKDNPGILNSRLAIFHYCGGKIAMEQRDWGKAYADLQEAFRFFEEGGSSHKIPCLKYMLVANMLREDRTIDPFTSPEVATMRNHTDIAPMANLADAYRNNDIMTFEKLLRVHKREILGDPFIEFFLQDLLREVRTQVMLQVTKPYTAISLSFLAEELRISQREVEALLVDLILDNKIHGHIDQVKQLLTLRRDPGQKTFNALEKWAGTLNNTQYLLCARV